MSLNQTIFTCPASLRPPPSDVTLPNGANLLDVLAALPAQNSVLHVHLFQNAVFVRGVALLCLRGVEEPLDQLVSRHEVRREHCYREPVSELRALAVSGLVQLADGSEFGRRDTSDDAEHVVLLQALHRLGLSALRLELVKQIRLRLSTWEQGRTG